ncbi:DUF5694 domain-containing protein [Hymenobacter algoricola]|uniref:TraB/GumN family protein n=1 Tax=Hymenobacter algoricola TaxID=486267 RepID=A0ABP7MFJ4_9BACT
MKYLLLLLAVLAVLAAPAARAQTKPAELLLLGTFHFHNPGLDLVKTKSFDILGPKAQAELETMTDKISRFHPTKIFVEAPWDKQTELDTLYRHYLRGDYEAYIQGRFPEQRRAFYRKNEIMQLAFRAGKKAGVPRIYGLDYTKTAFPYDSVIKAMQAAHQQGLIQAIEATFKAVEADQNRKIATFSLTQLLLDFNTPQSLTANKRVYIDKLNRAGAVGDFAGPYLVSEWYRRNLYMFSIVQKTMTPADGKAVVLVGAGHAAMMREFAELDPRFRLRELKDVLGK